MQDKLIILPIPLPAWLALINDLSVLERSAFTFLVASYCRHGFLPNDDVALAQIARVSGKTWLKIRPRLALKFPREGWRWPEIDQVIQKRVEKSGKRSRAGTQGNFKRWNGIPRRN